MIAVVAIYSHPEFYPPTLNAVQTLSDHFDKVYLICNNVIKPDWIYPTNVALVAIGPYLPIQQFEQQPILWKAKRFCLYLRTLRRLSQHANLVLTYDHIPLLAYGLGFRYLSRCAAIWWYHNHDVVDLMQLRKGSIGWLAAKLEPIFFRYLDVFSLPAEERKEFFPMTMFRGKYFFLPNFPAIHIYGHVPPPSIPVKELKLIYQGSISKGHGLETIIAILGQHQHCTLTLTLIGRIEQKYQKELEEYAKEFNTLTCLYILPAVGYKKLPAITAKHHIGLAIHEPQGLIYATGGTASNKIYEYAACGLPILFLNTPHYKTHLNQYVWAKGIDLDAQSILAGIDFIYNDYKFLSNAAKSDFLNVNNYEDKLRRIIPELTKK